MNIDKWDQYIEDIEDEEEQPQANPAVVPDVQPTEVAPEPVAETPQEPPAEEESGETITFENGETYNKEDIEYRNGIAHVKPDAAKRLRRESGGSIGQQWEGVSQSANQVGERLSAPGMGLADFGVDAAHTLGGLVGINLDDPKEAWDELTKNDDEVAKGMRRFASVVLPTMMGVGVTTNGIRALQVSKVTKGALMVGATAGVDAAVIGLSDEGTEDNAMRVISDTFPAVFGPSGFAPIPSQWKTLDSDSPAVRREKNMAESVGLSLVGDVLGYATSFGKKGLQWFFPKNQPAKVAKAEALIDRVMDPDTKDRLQAIENLLKKPGQTDEEIAFLNTELAKIRQSVEAGDSSAETVAKQLEIEEALASNPSAANKKVLKQELDDLTKQVSETGQSNLSSKTPLENELERAEAIRQLQLDESAIRKLESDAAFFDPEIMPGLAKPGATATQSIPPLNVARNMADTTAIKRGMSSGDPAPVLSDTFMRNGLVLGKSREVVAGLAETARDAGTFDAVVDGFRMTKAGMESAAWDIYKDIMRPMAKGNMRNQFLDNMATQRLLDGSEVKFFSEPQNLAAKLALQDLTDLYLGREVTESSARLMDTLGREITSLAEGADKYKAMVDDTRLQEMILDKWEFLTQEHGLNKYISGWMLSNEKIPLQQIAKSQDGGELAQLINSEFADAVSKRHQQIKDFRQTIELAKKSNPEILQPLMDVFRFTDGDVDTIAKLYKWADNQVTATGLIKSPERGQMNLFAKGFWGVRYNNVLSGLAAGRAFVGNGAAVLFKSISGIMGSGLEAAVGLNIEPIKKALYLNHSVFQTTHRAAQDGIRRARQIHMDPNAFEEAIRRDYRVTQESDRWGILDGLNQKWQQDKDYGRMLQYNLAKGMDGMHRNQYMRMGTTAMGGIDGATDTYMATLYSRLYAYDDVLSNQFKGQTPLTPKMLEKAEKQHYSNMFDENGLLTDKAAKNASGEIALNLDDGAANWVNTATTNFPILKKWFMFPRTAMNWLKSASSYTPIAMIPGMSKYNKVLFAGDDIDKIRIALAEHKIDFDSTPHAMAIYRNLATEYKGRIMLGTTTAAVFSQYALQGNIRGNGPVSGKERKYLKDNYGWREKTIKVGDKWVSYAGIPMVDPILTLVGDMAYYANDISDDFWENIHQKIGWTLSATWLNNSPMAGMEPVLKLMTGDESAWNRMIAQDIRATIPMSGALGVVSNAITSSLKDIHNDLWGYVGNRVPGASSTLTERIDPWTGKPVNDIDNPLFRMLNAVNPVPVSDGGEDWRQWLYNTGWDGLPHLTRHHDGYDYPADQREEVAKFIGTLRLDKKVEKMMKSGIYEEELATMRELRAAGTGRSEDFKIHTEKMTLYTELNKLANDARQQADRYMEEKYPYIDEIIYGQDRIDQLTQSGQLEEAQEAQRLYQEAINQLRQHANP